MMQSSSSSEDDSMSFDETSLSRKYAYTTESAGLKDFRYRTTPRPKFHDETDSLASVPTRITALHGRVNETDHLPQYPGYDSQHSISHTTPFTSRNSSFKTHRPVPAYSSSSIYSFADETKSQQVAATLQTPLLSTEDRSSSDRSNQWSSSDLSSIRSYSAISVPVTSHDKIRPYSGSKNLGTSSSSATGGGDMQSNSRFPSPMDRRGTAGSNPSRSETTATSTPSITRGIGVSSLDTAEELHKLRLQLYVFILRCIAYPFTVPLPQDPVRRYLKVTREYLGVLRERFSAFLNKELPIVSDEAFFNAVQHFDEIYLRDDSVERAVIAGGFSMNDFREVFVRSIERRLAKFDEIDGLPKQTVIGAWKVKFDQICRGGEGPCPIANRLGSPQLELTNLTKEQLYDLFMRILCIKKYEHQILFNACQLDSIDEQAAQVRRELADRKSFLEEIAINRRYPKMVHKEMEVQYVEEQIQSLNQLMMQLDTVPVGKSHGYTAGSSSAAVGVVVQLQRRLKKYSGLNASTGAAAAAAASTAAAAAIVSPILPVGQPNGGALSGGLEARRGGVVGLSPTRQMSFLAWGGGGEDGQTQHLTGEGSNFQVLSSINHVGGNVSKMAIQLSFSLEVMICQLRPLRHVSGNKQLFCTVELEGCSERQRTSSVKAAKPIWDTLAEFETAHPLPVLKVKLMKETTGALSLDHKELGRIVLLPNPSTSHLAMWYKLQPTKRCNDIIELQVAVKQERPSNLKHCGFCWVQGRSTFKKWKIRYICLIQVSQYTFIIAAFKEAKSVAYESMVLDGYTVDYCEVNQELVSVAKAELATVSGGLLSSSMPTLHKMRGAMSGVSSGCGFRNAPGLSVAVPSSREAVAAANAAPGGAVGPGGSGGGAGGLATMTYRLPRFFFNLVREGDALTFAVFEETELHAWVQAIHRATGQSHKPVPTVTRALFSKAQFRKGGDRDTAHHLGVSSLVATKPHEVDHLPLLKELLVCMMDYRLKDPFVSLGWLSPSENLVLEEYCNRYSIRECQRYLIFLNELLNFGEQDYMIDVNLIFQCYSLCADHVQGKTQEKGISTVLNAEMDEFQRLRTRLLAYLEKRLTGFRFHFPFNRPNGGLEKLLTLLDRVITQSNDGGASTEAVRSMVRVCLRNAAVLNYEKISDFAQQEGDQENPEKRLQDLLRLAEICIDTLQQNDDYYAKSFVWYGDLFVEHSENFLSLFQMDMTEVLDNLPSDNWGVFQIFQFLNTCLLDSGTLAHGQFHTALLDRFAPIVETYLSLMSTSITDFLVVGIEHESWVPMSDEGAHNTDTSDLNTDQPPASGQTHPDTDTEGISRSFGSLNRPSRHRTRSLRRLPSSGGGGERDGTSPSMPNGSALLPSSSPSTPAATSLTLHSSRSSSRRNLFKAPLPVVGPTSAFLDVLSRSRPLAFVSRVMKPTTTTATTSSSVVMGPRRSIVVITPPPLTSGAVREAGEGGGGGGGGGSAAVQEQSELAVELASVRCCSTVGTLIARLYALKEFIGELGWPERIKAAGWAETTRKMSSSLLREAAKRTLVELDVHLRQQSKSPDCVVPQECLTMFNTITAIRMQLFSLCHQTPIETTEADCTTSNSTAESPVNANAASFSTQPASARMYTETEAFLEGVHRQMSVILTDHLTAVLSTVLTRLARYDEGNLISSILTLAKPVDEDGRSYAQFISANLQILCQNLVDDVYLLSIFESWYTGQLRLIHEWLMERRNNVLHAYQIKCLSTIVRKVFSDFELQGVATHVLESLTYKNVCHRLQVEEATLSVSSNTRDSSPAASAHSSSVVAESRQTLMRVIGGGLSNLAQGAGLRHRQT